ncbi:MAG: serine/threonine-protein kinase [Alphaproteobacteria bacterium]|nr:serine/threonine-protein kinase [Alphaproteobacteria bacterium]
MNERDIFLAALERESVAERDAFIAQACAANAELRRRVELLFESHRDAGSFLEHPAIGSATVESRHDTDRPQAGLEPICPDDITLGAEATAVGELPSFLQPSTKPDSLGRIGLYEITEVLGRGGMGIVLRGHDTRLNRMVAIKVLSPQLASNPNAHKRFLREAQAAAAVSHPHVVTIHAVSEEDGNPYLVMEFVAGQSLQQKIDAQGAFEPREILRIGSQVAYGLAAAHAQGLIHRDVKPANILLENGVQRVKITDFGLARAADDVSCTQTGQIAGTPQYMSPEQAAGETIDHRSDLFSLGSVLYTMCTGRPAFRADSTLGVLRRVCDSVPRPIREINPDIPELLTGIIDRLLAKKPADRFQSAAETAELLERCLAHLQQPSLVPARIESPRPADVRPRARRLHWSVASALVLVALLTLGLSVADVWCGTRILSTMWQRAMESIGISRGPETPVAPTGTLRVNLDDVAHKLALIENLTRNADLVGHDGHGASWSSDGRQILYNRNDGSAIEVVEGDGKSVRTLVRAEDLFADGRLTDARFSPDDKHVAFVKQPTKPRYDGLMQEEVWIMTADGGTPRKLVDGSFPSWGGDANLLFFHDHRRLALMSIRLDASVPSPRNVTRCPGRYPVVSPDGRHAAYAEGNRLRVFELETNRTVAEWRCFDPPLNGMLVAWSPDGQELSIGGYTNGYVGLWIYDLRTQQATRVAEGPVGHGRWSPEGHRFSFDLHTGRANIWVLTLEPGKSTTESLLALFNQEEYAPLLPTTNE